MSTPTLFEMHQGGERERLAEKLRRLAARGAWLGTSSWKYPGWIGDIYTRERYLVRGRFSERLFRARCLSEYAEVFPIVGGDFSFYQFPSSGYWRELFSSASPELLYAFKVPDQITVKIFPRHARYGDRAGMVNPAFLDVALLADAFLGPLEDFRRQVAVLIFEFGAFSEQAYERAGKFFEELDRFMEKLPGGWRYAVEIRNAEYLVPDYFACLRAHGVAHVFNAWTRMPELSEQFAIPGAFTADFSVCRALLARGRSYEQAVKIFEPYDRIREVNSGVRNALRLLVERATRTGPPVFIFINNRLEGNAPGTIRAILEAIEES